MEEKKNAPVGERTRNSGIWENCNSGIAPHHNSDGNVGYDSGGQCVCGIQHNFRATLKSAENANSFFCCGCSASKNITIAVNIKTE